MNSAWVIDPADTHTHAEATASHGKEIGYLGVEGVVVEGEGGGGEGGRGVLVEGGLLFVCETDTREKHTVRGTYIDQDSFDLSAFDRSKKTQQL